MPHAHTPPGDHRVRLDKWLWAARFYKTRSLATEAVAGGKVDVNDDRAKPAKLIRAGDAVRIRQPPYEHIIIVQALAERRGSAAIAQTLYTETPESLAARQRLAAEHRIAAVAFDFQDKGRPSKRDRRQLADLRGRQQDD
jgi:ribosome-associated heat shock protein Hsp15